MNRAYYPSMHSSSPRVGASPSLRLNVEKLNELRRAHGIKSEAELARLIGVDVSTLYRVSNNLTSPSPTFVAGLKLAFPAASLDSLFDAVRAEAVA